MADRHEGGEEEEEVVDEEVEGRCSNGVPESPFPNLFICQGEYFSNF